MANVSIELFGMAVSDFLSSMCDWVFNKQVPPFVVNISSMVILGTCFFKTTGWFLIWFRNRKEKKELAKEKKVDRSQELIDKFYFEDLIHDIALKQVRSKLLNLRKAHCRCAEVLREKNDPEIISKFNFALAKHFDLLRQDLDFLSFVTEDCYKVCSRELEDIEDLAVDNLWNVLRDPGTVTELSIYSKAIYKIYLTVIEDYKKWVRSKATSSIC